jgi:nucleotide-binding universal stress UspA family protein
MTATTRPDSADPGVTVRTSFERVLVGVDRSPVGTEAARQAAVLVAPEGMLEVLAAWTVPPPNIGVVSPDLMRVRSEAVYRRAAAEAVALALPPTLEARTATKVVRGFAWDELIAEAEAIDAQLVAVGSHGQGRMRGIVMGSTATALVHRAPCPVLVVRPADTDFPRRVVVGVDGSPESALAFATARAVADRFGSDLWPVVAHGGDGVDETAVAAVVDYHHEPSPDEPVHALVAASADADLLVVGSRGLHGVKALGSVSERVAHQARCSTLIVRRR